MEKTLKKTWLLAGLLAVLVVGLGSAVGSACDDVRHRCDRDDDSCSKDDDSRSKDDDSRSKDDDSCSKDDDSCSKDDDSSCKDDDSSCKDDDSSSRDDDSSCKDDKPCDEPKCVPTCTTTLWAAKHLDVGQVSVVRKGLFVYVRYETRGGWTLREVHLEIGCSLLSVPRNKGGPIPGRFRWKAEVDGTSYTFKLPVWQLPWGRLHVFAHAVVQTGDCRCECSSQVILPSKPVKVCTAVGNPQSYLRHTIYGAGALDGVYDAWCVDLEGGIEPGTCYEGVSMLSSLSPEARILVNYPENWDLVNYLLNQDYKKTLGATWLEIQYAIWTLLDSGTPNPGQGVPDQDILDQILADVHAKGNGFVPGRGQILAILLAKVGIQTTIVGVRIPECPPCGDETAWAGNCEDPGRNWARYFICIPGCR